MTRELYDHEKDPQENANIIGNEVYEALLDRLSERLNKGWRGALPDEYKGS